MSLNLQLETLGGLCSAACRFCPLVNRDYYKEGRKIGQMSWELFTKIIDEAATIPQITQVCLTGLSESLLDTKLAERVKYARAKLPHAFIDTYTNGIGLTLNKFNSLKDAGISCVTVSLNAVNAEQHQKIMGVGPKAFDKVIWNIENAIANRGAVWIQVKAVVDGQNFTYDDMAPFYERWGSVQKGGFGQVVMEANWAGTMPNARKPDPNSCCDRAIGQIYILWDGITTLCCLDPLGLFARDLTGHPDGLGNLNTQTIREVYNSDKYTFFRSEHNQNRAGQFNGCKVCTRV